MNVIINLFKEDAISCCYGSINAKVLPQTRTEKQHATKFHNQNHDTFSSFTNSIGFK